MAVLPVELGYVDVTTGLVGGPTTLHTFPFRVLVPLPDADPADPDPLPNFFEILGANELEVVTPGVIDLRVGALLRRNDDTGQEIEILAFAEPALVDSAVTVRINTSVLTTSVDYDTDPTPRRGESIIEVGTSSVGASPVPDLWAVVGTRKGTTPTLPRDVTEIVVGARLDLPHRLTVGQARRPTVAATYTSVDKDYRRAVDGDLDGIRLELTASTPTVLTGELQWLAVDLTQPRSGDGPVRPTVAGAVGGLGNVPTTGRRRYRTTWVHPGGNETAASPPSEPVATGSGRVQVDLPVWVDPQTPVIGGTAVAEPVDKVRIYRTATSDDGDAGEYFLVEELDLDGDPSWIDTRSDEDLGEVLLTDLEVRVRHLLRIDPEEEGPGLSRLDGTLHQGSYEELADGTPAFRGTTYDVDVHAMPPTTTVAFTTRPAVGRPRVSWRSTSAGATTGVGSGDVTITPTGLAAGTDQRINALIAGLPGDIGVDWLLWGAGVVTLAVGTADDATARLAQPVGLVRIHALEAPGTLPSSYPPVSPRAVEADLGPGRMVVAARRVARLLLLLGQPHPDGSAHAVAGDGVVAELELDRGDDPIRSLRVVREAEGPAGRSRFMARIGDLPDRIEVDVRPGTDETRRAGRLTGRLTRVVALVQDEAQLAIEDTAGGRRRDGYWFALPDSGERIEAVLEGDRLTAELDGDVRVDCSIRSTVGLGSDDLRVHHVQGTVRTGGSLEVSFPEEGATSVAAPKGATGRLAVSTLAPEPSEADRLLAVRATPQVKAQVHHTVREGVDALALDRATARWLAIAGVSLPAAESGDPFVITSVAERANTAFRAHAVLTDTRMRADPWDLAKVSVADAPESVTVNADTDLDRYRVRLDRRSGRVVVFAQPPLVPADGPLAGTVVGVGLAKADIDGLPTDVQLDLLGGGNDFAAVPRNATPPGDWRRSGFRIDTDGELVARALQVISVDMVRPAAMAPVPVPGGGMVLVPIPPTAFWSNTAASLVKVAAGSGSPAPVWLWTPSEALPGTGELAPAWEDLDSWIGWRIEEPSEVTLQIQVYDDQRDTTPRFWHDGFSWEMNAELQMEDHRDEITVDADLSPEGEGGSLGLWYLRVPDGAPFDGQVVFGNTGGWISSRPRIFAPFDPEGGP